ncbi:RDD family protein, partial [uncultured Cellulomonas sp.]|uniref:RDD family protein n=1 Tax=uncultured Cellulomonas sp. TaxID=189682 RepID=UPI0028ED27F8
MPPEPGRRARPGAPVGPVPITPGSVAPVGTRVLAYVLDTLVLLAAVGVGSLIRADVPAAPALLAAVAAVAQWVAEARTGATVGNAVTGIRTLSATTGRPAGLGAVLLRQVVVGAGALLLVVGQWVVVASGAWDRSPAQRGWHDRAAGTVVLRARAVRRGPALATARSTG